MSAFADAALALAHNVIHLHELNRDGVSGRVEPSEVKLAKAIIANANAGDEAAQEYTTRRLTIEALEFFKKHPNGINQYDINAMVDELIWIRTAPKKSPPPSDAPYVEDAKK